MAKQTDMPLEVEEIFSRLRPLLEQASRLEVETERAITEIGDGIGWREWAALGAYTITININGGVRKRRFTCASCGITKEYP